MHSTLPSLDHLILFLPASPTKSPSIPSFFSSAFTLTPGGAHADGLTSNTLILLADGCYIELICFLPEASAEKIAAHWWGPDRNRRGWTDWCLTNGVSPEANFEAVKKSHGEPVRGARVRPDGVEVKWAVTFPIGEKGGQRVRGKVPFYCHDVTKREVRVPITPASTAHPCGAIGVSELTVIVKDKEALEATRTAYASLFGNDGAASGDEIVFTVGRVESVEGLEDGSRIVLRLPRGNVEEERVKVNGFWFGDVVLAARGEEGKAAGSREHIDGSGENGVCGLWVEYV